MTLKRIHDLARTLLGVFMSPRHWPLLALLIFVAICPYPLLALASLAVPLAWASRELTCLHAAIRLLNQVADGDHFVVFPPQASRAGRSIAVAAENMRRRLMKAEAAIVDGERILAEARIRRDAAAFFTSRFHDSVEIAVAQFAMSGDEICSMVRGLNGVNDHLLRDAHSVSGAVDETANEVEAVSRAASDIARLVGATSDQLSDADRASETALKELQTAKDTIGALRAAAGEIETIMSVIRSVASQTSLLALNATIEAARAGDAGRGFAVVASEVKTLAEQSSKASDTIRAQIAAMRDAVDGTAASIDGVLGRVSVLTKAQSAFAATLSDNTTAVERVGLEAGSVARRVSGTLPNLVAGVREIEAAGRSMLTSAENLMDGSQSLTARFRGYFKELESGSIKVGILHSLSGTVTLVERPAHDLLIGLIDETNRSGGLLGRPLEAVIFDTAAEPARCGEGARALVAAGAVAIFGGWTTPSRIAIRPELLGADCLLFYPSQYEGGEACPDIFYMGGTPQQQAFPAVDFLASRGRRDIFLVGRRSIFTTASHHLIRRHAASTGCRIVGEIWADGSDPSQVLTQLMRSERNHKVAVISTLSGEDSVRLFREMARRGVSAERMPVMSLSVQESEIASCDAGPMDGHFISWNYLSALDGESNRDFTRKWRTISGNPQGVPNDLLEATFIGFNLWKAAVEAAETTGKEQVRTTLKRLNFLSPSGYELSVTQDQHTSLPAFVGRIERSGLVKVIWATGDTLLPDGTSAKACALKVS